MYIIDPKIIYLFNLLNSLRGISIAAAITCGILTFIYYVLMETGEISGRAYKSILIAFIVSVVLVVVIPSEDTMILMLAAKICTIENLTAVKNVTIDTVKEIIDYVAQVLK